MVRRGYYTAPVFQKALAILGQPGANLILPPDRQLPAWNAPIVIRGIPKGREFKLRGFQIFYNQPLGGWLRVENSPGRVHLENLSVLFSITSFNRGTPGDTVIRDCAAVTLDGCILAGQTYVQNSRVVINDCFMNGWIGTVSVKGISGRATPGLTIIKNAHVLMNRVTAVGGIGASTGTVVTPPAPGVLVDGASLVLQGDAGLIQAGSLARIQTPAVQGKGNSSLLLDPGVTLRPAGGAKATDGFRSTRTRRMPVLMLRGGQIGQQAEAELRGSAGQLYRLAIAQPADQPTSLAPFVGTFWLQTAGLAQLSTGTLGSSGKVTVRRTVPNAAGLRGLVVAVQALVGANNSFAFSNPRVLVVR